MRLKGFSYNEISCELGIAKSTLSGWFKDMVLNEEAKERLKVFIKFLLEILFVPQNDIRANMHLYPHINENEALRFWMEITNLPKERFFKSNFSVSSASKRILPYNRLPWGTLKIEVCDTAKFHYLLGLIQGVKDQFNCDIMPSLLG